MIAIVWHAFLHVYASHWDGSLAYMYMLRIVVMWGGKYMSLFYGTLAIAYSYVYASYVARMPSG